MTLHSSLPPFSAIAMKAVPSCLLDGTLTLILRQFYTATRVSSTGGSYRCDFFSARYCC